MQLTFLVLLQKLLMFIMKKTFNTDERGEGNEITLNPNTQR